MQSHLYFITEFCKSLRAGDSKREINKMIRKIINKGEEQKYRIGFEQFLLFVEAGQSGWMTMPESHKQLIMQVINEVSIESSKDITSTHHGLSLQLERDGDVIFNIDISSDSQSFVVGDLLPGMYSLKTDSDWLLWQTSLSETDLMWTHAYPDLDLPMAADTEDILRGDYREVVLLDSEVVLRIYPGLEAGSMNIMVEGHDTK